MVDIEKIMPVTEVKKYLLDIFKNMSEEQSTITVTRNGKPISVMMTPERYEALMETIEILADREIVVSLVQSSNDFKSGRVYDDTTVWQD